jgi:hypothetical protein
MLFSQWTLCLSGEIPANYCEALFDKLAQKNASFFVLNNPEWF